MLINYIKSNSVVIIILCIIALQNPIWPLWYVPYMPLSFLFCIFLFLKKYNSREIKKSKSLLPIFAMIMAFVVLPFLRGGFHGSNFIYILCFIATFSISYEEASLTLDLLSKGFGVIIGISLIAWIFSLAVHPLPLLGYYDLTEMKGNTTIMEIYGFFVQNPDLRAFRFFSVFDEPGVVGTLGAYILYANKYQFTKWYNIAIFVGCLCTMSLAFYALTVIGLIYTSLGSAKRLIVIFATLLVVVWIGYDFIKENQDFYDLIIGRFLNASESLNSRAGDSIDAYYDKMNLWDFLIGIGSDRVAAMNMNEGASYKNFIVEHGFISIIILVIGYWSLQKKTNRDVLVFVGMFWLSFLQRPTSFIGWQMLLYACIVTYMARPTVKIKHYNTIKISNDNKICT